MQSKEGSRKRCVDIPIYSSSSSCNSPACFLALIANRITSPIKIRTRIVIPIIIRLIIPLNHQFDDQEAVFWSGIVLLFVSGVCVLGGGDSVSVPHVLVGTS